MKENNRSRRPAPRNKRRTSKTVIVLMCIVVALLLALISMMIAVVVKKVTSPEETLPPVTTIATEATETTAPTEATVPTEPTKELQAKVIELNTENPDVVGWIKIDGTVVDYPVVYTPDNESKYLYKDIYGKSDVNGSLIIDKRYTLDPRSDNIIIHGHNMAKGDMFHCLLEYENKEYWEEHPTFTYADVNGEYTYEVLGCFYDRVYYTWETTFKYYFFTDPETEEEFNEGIKYFKDLTPYDTGVTAEYGDNLITLSTCAYHTEDGRFVVVAREVTE